MIRSLEGDHTADSLRFGIVASRFNDEIVSGLIDGAVDCLRRHGASDEALTLHRVPGAFEIPLLLAPLARSRRFDSLIALGALIRGDTPHFDFISIQVTTEISRVSVETSIPIAFGVITCNTIEQARERSGDTANKGWEAALAAIEMANLFRLTGKGL